MPNIIQGAVDTSKVNQARRTFDMRKGRKKMPVKVKKTNGYRVSTPHGTKAKHTTYQKAMKQASLLRAVEHGWKPTGKKSKRTYKHGSGTLMGEACLRSVGALK